MTTPTFLDLSQAQVFAEEPAEMQALMVTFEQSLGQEVAQIQAGIAAGDAQQVERSLHALKGFLPLFVRADLGQAVIDLYQHSRQQPLSATATTFTSLVPSLEGLLAEVRAWLAAL